MIGPEGVQLHLHGEALRAAAGEIDPDLLITIADEILGSYEEVHVRSFVMTLANRRAREILKRRSTAAPA